jgi:NADH:ubiquinone oxidoreductase subunit 3 (subunit A)
MKEILATWIIFQLIIIGFITWDLSHDINTNTYECAFTETEAEKWQYIMVWIVFPLLVFNTFESDVIDAYCNRI